VPDGFDSGTQAPCPLSDTGRPLLTRLVRSRPGYLVAAWLGGIVVNLLLVGGYGDSALRDFGLLLAALTLTRLASAFHGREAARAPTDRW
jgi:hypothetical protein